MKKYLLRICLVATLLCGFFLDSAVEAKGAVAGCQQDEQQIKQHDGWIHQVAEEPESIPVTALRSSSSSHRLASSRTVRQLSTHGGKATHHSGRWAKDQSSHLPKYSLRLPCIGHHQRCMAAASPRRYYVIALRRLLC